MKRRKYFIVMIVVLAVALALSAGACSFLDDLLNEQLTKPVLKLDQQKFLVTWEPVNHANSYRIQVNDELITEQTRTSYSVEYLPNGDYTVSVRALANGGFKESDWAKIKIRISGSDITDDGDEENPDPSGGEGENPDPGDDNNKEDLPEPQPLPDASAQIDATALKSNLYYVKGSQSDAIGYVPKGAVIAEINALGLDREYWYAEADKHAFAIRREYAERFAAGTRIKVKIVYEDGSNASFYLNITRQQPYQVIQKDSQSEDLVLYDKSESKLSLQLVGASKTLGVANAILIDGAKIKETPTYSSATNSIVISATASGTLNQLSIGEHVLQIATDRGITETTLFVTRSGEFAPYGLQIDYDNPEGKLWIRWNSDTRRTTKISVEVVGGSTYTNMQSAYADRFCDGCFDATGLLAKDDVVRIKATVDGQEYTSGETVSLPIDPTDETYLEYLSYDRGYEWLGTTYNYLISSEEEFRDYIFYALTMFPDLSQPSAAEWPGVSDLENYRALDFYLAMSDKPLYGISSVVAEMKSLIQQYPEAYKYSLIRYQASGNVVTVLWQVKSSSDPIYHSPTTAKELTSEEDLHLGRGTRGGEYQDFAYRSWQKTALVTNSFQVYMALEKGVRPIGVVGSNAEAIIQAAEDVLRLIIDDDMDDYAKVHAIYDWIGDTVVYDHDIADQSTGINPNTDAYNKFYRYECFFAEGVFFKHADQTKSVAVCNGIAAAFSILANMEGIECYKVNGYMKSGFTNVGHAWVKVYIAGNWYVCDATWANARVSSSSNDEVLSHDYLLMTSAQSKPSSEHVETNNRNLDRVTYGYGSDSYDWELNWEEYAKTVAA